MARKPNYDFERRQREKTKSAKTADRVKAKTGQASERESPSGQAASPVDSKALPTDKLNASNDD